MKVGASIRKLRVLKGYSQEYVADTLSISQKSYSLLENDKTEISLTRLERVAEVFEVSLFQILEDCFSDKEDSFYSSERSTKQQVETKFFEAIENMNQQIASLRNEIRWLKKE